MSSCGGCDGRCCRRFFVPLTGADVALIAGSGLKPDEFVEWVPVGSARCDLPDVRLWGGYYYMVLGRRADGACVLSEDDGGRLRCGVHGRHPVLCRLFPHRLWGGRAGVCLGLEVPGAGALAAEGRADLREYELAVSEWNGTRRRLRGPGDFFAHLMARL
jgi:Fe-S-cluster containining protein